MWGGVSKFQIYILRSTSSSREPSSNPSCKSLLTFQDRFSVHTCFVLCLGYISLLPPISLSLSYSIYNHNLRSSRTICSNLWHFASHRKLGVHWHLSYVLIWAPLTSMSCIQISIFLIAQWLTVGTHTYVYPHTLNQSSEDKCCLAEIVQTIPVRRKR